MPKSCIATAPDGAGSIAHAFLLPPSPVIRLPAHHARILPPTLFPDLTLVRSGPADATLTPLHGARAWSGRLLHATDAWLRLPPVRGSQPRYAITLRSVSRVQAATWADRLLGDATWFTPALERRGAELARDVAQARVGGAWWGAQGRPAKVVVFAARCPNRTRTLLQAALSGWDASTIALVAPRAGSATSAARRAGVRVLLGAHDPWPLIEQAAEVFAAPGSAESLVAAFVRPQPDVARTATAMLILGARYVDPFHLRPATAEQFLAFAAECRLQRDRNSGIACCVGISFWKRSRVADMLGGRRSPAFSNDSQLAIRAAKRRGGGIAVWPSRAPPRLEALAAEAGIPVWRVEDGFVRSAGLGADFRPPLSLVLDRLGIYYDATAPSDLERILASTQFEAGLLRRAAALRARLVRERVTKYNLPASHGIPVTRHRFVILVPGQVSDDRSVLLGGAGLGPGLELVQQVRAQAPGAHIVYKPHPDVDAGHRAGAVPDREILRWADQIVRGGSIVDLLEQIHAVHTLTSSTGFEAILRGIPVTTYGQPFYAGWGLTTDLKPPARRVRRLTLDELVAGTLIIYPRYFDPVTRLGCGPEIVLDRLRDLALHRAGPLILVRRLHGQIKRFIEARR